MKSKTTPAFWRLFRGLDANTQKRARDAFTRWTTDPHHPSLRFKRVSRSRSIYAARIGLEYRAVGILAGDTVTWFWIGPHDEYDRLIG